MNKCWPKRAPVFRSVNNLWMDMGHELQTELHGYNPYDRSVVKVSLQLVTLINDWFDWAQRDPAAELEQEQKFFRRLDFNGVYSLWDYRRTTTTCASVVANPSLLRPWRILCLHWRRYCIKDIIT
jgi:hypothetical protein